jgi:hypothetical protein
LARDGLSAFDPTATLQSGIAALPIGLMQRRVKDESRSMLLRYAALVIAESSVICCHLGRSEFMWQ